MTIKYEDDQTIPHATRDDTFKTGLYALVGLIIAISLIAGTIWLLVAA